MTRLWDKGLPLSERVLRYTAGEDHLLDARLVQYDVRGSIAHAEMLAATGLISEADAGAIVERLPGGEGADLAGDRVEEFGLHALVAQGGFEGSGLPEVAEQEDGSAVNEGAEFPEAVLVGVLQYRLDARLKQ